MPHILVKMYSGRPDELKLKLANELKKTTVAVLNCDPNHTTIAIEDVEKEKWNEQVFEVEIKNNPKIIKTTV